MTDMDVTFSSITELSSLLESGESSSIELTERVFERIKQFDPSLKAFVTLTESRAMKEAKASDERRKSGNVLGPLDGIPYAVKDIFDVADLPTMAGLSILSDNIAEHDCTAVQRLCDAGMVLIGKTHTVQLAFYITGLNGDLGTPHNPWSKIHHIPGGSSSGSAVAVGAGLVPLALGSDTAGSIRVPAALCGTVGLKPTGGHLGRGGVRPLSWTLDTIGPLTRTVYDSALVFEVLQGPDPRDETTLMTPSSNLLATLEHSLDGMEILICDNLFFEDCDSEVIDAVEEAGNVLASLGAIVRHGELPEIREAFEQPYQNTIISTEAFAVNGPLLEQHKSEIDSDGYWMEAGKTFSGTEYYHALRAQASAQRCFSERLGNTSAILVPTAANPAWPVEKIQGGEVPKVSYSRNTGVANYLNLSSISVPCGFTTKGLPIGAMICARPFDDALVTNIANVFQQATSWHLDRPMLEWARS
jgi:aspartyl-tRNA(Asn)/glutamyl-tRNA(Gln) amidotransferase subunit A